MEWSGCGTRAARAVAGKAGGTTLCDGKAAGKSRRRKKGGKRREGRARPGLADRKVAGDVVEEGSAAGAPPSLVGEGQRGGRVDRRVEELKEVMNVRGRAQGVEVENHGCQVTPDMARGREGGAGVAAEGHPHS